LKVPREKIIDGWIPRIEQLIEEYQKPPITVERIFEKLVELGFDGGKSVVKEAVRKLRPPAVKAVERFETAPGVQGDGLGEPDHYLP